METNSTIGIDDRKKESCTLQFYNIIDLTVRQNLQEIR